MSIASQSAIALLQAQGGKKAMRIRGTYSRYVSPETQACKG